LILLGEVSLRSTSPTLLPPLDAHATLSPVLSSFAIASSGMGSRLNSPEARKLQTGSSMNHVLAQIELFTKPGQYQKQVYTLPRHLDEKGASLDLAKIGAELHQNDARTGEVLGFRWPDRSRRRAIGIDEDALMAIRKAVAALGFQVGAKCYGISLGQACNAQSIPSLAIHHSLTHCDRQAVELSPVFRIE
jgi:S-adenosyl-L-homocysteine hydrolase